MRSMEERLRELVGSKRVVRLSVPDDEGLEHSHGFVVGMSRSLVVLHEVIDFHIDGYRVFHTKSISEVRNGMYERTQNRILKSRGLHKFVDLPHWLKYGSWSSFFRSVKLATECVSVESKNYCPSVVAIGEILSIGDTTVSLREFDARARWVDDPFVIRFKSLTSAGFGGEYDSCFYEFIRTR